MRAFLKLLATMAAFAAMTSPALAQAEDDDSGATTVVLHEHNPDASKTYHVDTAIPSAPALTLLGVDTPSTIGAPFGGDQYFNFGAGDGGLPEVAFATRPYWTVFHQDQGIVDYRGWANPDAPDDPSFGERLRHIAGRTIVSFAVGPVRGDEESRGGAAIGISSSLLDNADPRLDPVFATCVRDVLAASRGVSLTISSEEARALAQTFAAATWRVPSDAQDMEQFFAARPWAPPTERRLERKFTNSEDRARALVIYRTAEQRRDAPFAEAADRGYAECMKTARERYLEEPDLVVGFGAFLQGEEKDSLEGLGYAGTSAWIGYRYPLSMRDGRQGAFNAYARFEERADQALENNVVSDTQTTIGYVDYSLSSDRWRFTLAASYVSREYEDPAVLDREFQRYSVSGEYRIQENIWVELGYGALSEEVPGEDSFSYLRLKYNLSGGSD